MKHHSAALFILLCLAMVIPAQAKNPHNGNDSLESLPPGLQKKVARGGQLPPGWERKLQVGEPLDAELYRQSEPVTSAIKASLPVGPSGTVEVRLEGKVVRLLEATREIVDVFDLDKIHIGK